MKDYVFIGWSRNRDLAIVLKDILDRKGFICVIGGVYENNPTDIRIRRGTVNETINFQMNHCDQAILLFQKIDDNLSISGNLIYELGYINAQYNFIESATKLHIFKIDITQADDNLFPSDLHGIWGTSVLSQNKTIEEMAQEIAEEFINNQSQINKADKFKLLNDHRFVEYEIKKHFESPSMSDYDLASNILVYLQSAFCYQEQNDIKLKMEQFKTKMNEKEMSSKELIWAVNYAILTLKLFCLTIPSEDSLTLSLEGVDFRKLLNGYKSIGEEIAECFQCFEDKELGEFLFDEEFCEINDFESLLIAQMQEHVTYLILVYLFSNISQDEKIKYAKLGLQYCNSTIKNFKLIAKRSENEYYSKMLMSYAYKNLATFYEVLGEEEKNADYKKQSFKLRKDLYLHANGLSALRPSLKDYINVEYFLQVVEIVKNCEDEYEKADYMLEIDNYLKQRQKEIRARDYMIDLLNTEYNNLKNAK
ncbi:MAG: hypothetical protein ACI4MO_04735 [Christensenellales bacterium]